MLRRVLLCALISIASMAAFGQAEDDRQAMNAAYREYQAAMAKGVNFRHEAIEPAARAFALAKTVHGTSHQTTAALAINYGNILQNRAEAAEVLKEALSISEAVYGRDAIELVDPLMALGDASTDLRDLKAARDYFARALQIAQRHEAPNSFLEGIITLSLGVTNFNDGRQLDAIRQFRGARDILAQHEGILARIRLATADLWIGTHQVQQGRHQEAIEPLLTSLAAFKSVPEAEFSALANLKLLVEAYEALGQREEATQYALEVGAQTITEPVLLYEVPAVLGRVRTPGIAVLSFTVDAQGYPKDATVVNEPGDARFSETALATVGKLRYAPRFVDGAAVETTGVMHTFVFRPAR